MSLQRAIKFCELCYGYNCDKINNLPGSATRGSPEEEAYFRYQKLRDKATERAMKALEHCFEVAETESGKKEVEKVLTVCLDCKYEKPSIERVV